MWLNDLINSFVLMFIEYYVFYFILTFSVQNSNMQFTEQRHSNFTTFKMCKKFNVR